MYVRATLTEKVKLAPQNLHGDYATRVYEHLKTKLEGKCTRFGYIKEGSVEPVSLHMGTLEAQTFRGFVVFEVKCTASICNPTVGSILRAKVVSSNNFGLLCMSLDDGGSGSASGTPGSAQVMDIIVPKDMKTVTSAVDIRQVRVGDIVDVQLIGKKYELYSTKIVVVGVIQRVEAAAAAAVATKTGRKSAAASAATDAPGVMSTVAAAASAPSTVASRLLAFDDEDDFTFDDDDAEVEDDEAEPAEGEADEGGVDGIGNEDAEDTDDRQEDREPSGEDEEEDESKEGEKSKSDEEESEDEAFEEEGFDEDDEDDIHYSDDE